jgi:hypothetical protein
MDEFLTEHAAELNLEHEPVTEQKQRGAAGSYNGSVLDAEVRQRLGGADVHGRERRAQDAEQQPEVVPPGRVGRRRARVLELAAHPPAPPLPPLAGAELPSALAAAVRIRAFHERRERLPAPAQRRVGRRPAPRARRRQPQRREARLPVHGRQGAWSRMPETWSTPAEEATCGVCEGAGGRGAGRDIYGTQGAARKRRG